MQSGGEKCDLHLIDQREWPFILPGPRTRAWREMWHEMLEFQSGEVSEERYVLALAVNCRNQKKHYIPCHQPLSPVVLCTDALSHFPRKFNGRILEVPIGRGRAPVMRHRSVRIYREVLLGESTPDHSSRVQHHWKGEERQVAAVLRGSSSNVAVHEAVLQRRSV